MYKYILILLFSTVLWSCGKTKKPEPKTSNVDSIRLAESGLDSVALELAPEWFIKLPESDSVFYAAATAKSSRANIARDKAVMKAQTQLAEMVKSGSAPGGADIGDKSLGELTIKLENVIISNQLQVQDGKLWRAYILLEMKK